MPSVERGAVRQHNNLPQRSKASGPATSSTTAADKRHKAAPDDKEKLSASQASTSKGIRPKEDRRTQHSSTNSAHQRNLTPTNIETFLLRPSISEETRQSFPSLDIGLIDSEITIGGPQNYSAGTRHENASDCLATEANHTGPGSVLQATIRVIGAAGVGKSLFIKAASITKDGQKLSDTVSVVVDRCLCKLTFQEVPLELLEDKDGHDEASAAITRAADHHQPRGRQHSGTIILFDVMNKDSLYGVPDLLRIYRETGEAVVLVAAKCDNPPTSRQAHTHAIADKARTIMEGIQVFESALNDRAAPLAAVQALLSIVISQASVATSMRSRPRSDSAALADEPFGPLLKASRSSLELIGVPEQGVTAAELKECSTQPGLNSGISDSVGRPRSGKYRRQRSASNHLEPPPPPPGWAASSHSFLILDDLSSSEADESGASDSEGVELNKLNPPGTPASFSDLVDILLRPVPKDDDFDYMQTFLAFYRLFAPPSALLDAILLHYQSVTESTVMHWDRETILDHDIAVIDTWIKQYPGDFAKDLCRRKLEEFLCSFVPNATTFQSDIGAGDSGYFSANIRPDDKNRAAAARQIRTALESVVEDEDTEWACTDTGATRHQLTTTPLMAKPLSKPSKNVQFSHASDLAKAARNNSKYDNMLIFGGPSTLTLNAIGSGDRGSSRSSISASLNISLSAQRQASLLTSSSIRPLDKGLWRFVLEQSEDTIARELTRIDWILFSAIRPRNLVRHATEPPSPSTAHVSQLNDHFNHLAYWVTNMILLRDKPKHRSQMLEKMMRVAMKLRKVNNYNALAAFVAAIRGPALARLSMTRDLVDAGVQKKFASFEVLMSTARGHWAYRFALDNTEQGDHPRIPFLPLHRRDLIVAESAGKTFLSEDAPSSKERFLSRESSASSNTGSTKSSATLVSSKSGSTSSSATLTSRSAAPSASARKVNWPKFAVMGETLTILRKAQSIPYTGFASNEAIKAALLDVKLCKDDDQLWERSLALEAGGPSAVGEGQRAQVKNWIQDGIEKLKGVGRDV